MVEILRTEHRAAAVERGDFVALTSIEVVDFASVAPKTKPPAPPPAPQPTPIAQNFWGKWGPIIVVAVLGPALTLMGQYLFRSADKAGSASDEHVKQLVQPLIESANNSIGTKLDKIDGRLNDLASKVDHVQGQVDELNARATKLGTDQDGLRKQISGQEAVIRLQDPNRIFATIRGEIETAEKERAVLPPSQLADYRNALQVLSAHKAKRASPAAPDAELRTQSHYWLTVAAIINYQSFLNQLSGEAPDPTKVARPCFVGNLSSMVVSSSLANCIAYIDYNSFKDVRFENSVIIYKGGPVSLEDVEFVNCRFVLDLPPAVVPAKEDLLLALLDAPDQKAIQVKR
jgi:hypothetical protein